MLEPLWRIWNQTLKWANRIKPQQKTVQILLLLYFLLFISHGLTIQPVSTNKNLNWNNFFSQKHQPLWVYAYWPNFMNILLHWFLNCIQFSRKKKILVYKKTKFFFYFTFCSSEIDITVSLLLEMDKLVQLLESHIFLCKFGEFIAHSWNLIWKEPNKLILENQKKKSKNRFASTIAWTSQI